MRCKITSPGRKVGKQTFAWIEIKFNPDDVDISEFIRGDRTLDKEAMQKAIKEELVHSHQKTLQWQNTAILKAFRTN